MSEDSIFVPSEERKGTLPDLLGIWTSTQIGILGLIYGAIIVSYGLNFIQSTLAASVGALSFILVGVLSLPGVRAGTSMFYLSRVVFGVKGNYLPTLAGWINLMGWLCVNIVTATLTLLALLSAFGISWHKTGTLAALLLVMAIVVGLSWLQQNFLSKVQQLFVYVFGTLTLIVLAFILVKTDWKILFNMKSGNWLTGFLPAVAIIMAGTGFSWAIAASDYSMFQKPSNKEGNIVAVTAVGGFIPLFILMFTGVLMTSSVPDFLYAENPIAVIGDQLPVWMTVPYLLTATVGLLAPSIVSFKSARINMATLNINMKDRTAFTIQFLITFGISVYVLFFSSGFMDIFQEFLGLIGLVLSAWAGVFLSDFILYRNKAGYDKNMILSARVNPVNPAGAGSFILSVFCALLFTKCAFFTGPFAVGIFENTSVCVLFSFILAFTLYALWPAVKKPVLKG